MPLRKRRPDVLTRLRGLCLALPGTAEVTKWGHPNFVVGRKIFAVYEQYKGEWAICFKAEPAQQLELVTADPRFYVTPDIGKQGWVSMKADGVRWPETKRFIHHSYRLVTSLAVMKLFELTGDLGPRPAGGDLTSLPVQS